MEALQVTASVVVLIAENLYTKCMSSIAIEATPHYTSQVLTTAAVVHCFLVCITTLLQIKQVQNTISTATFGAQGQLIAYAASYDWFQGGSVDAANQSKGHAIYLHLSTDEEVKPRDKPRK
jgi:hypothetical protein